MNLEHSPISVQINKTVHAVFKQKGIVERQRFAMLVQVPRVLGLVRS